MKLLLLLLILSTVSDVLSVSFVDVVGKAINPEHISIIEHHPYRNYYSVYITGYEWSISVGPSSSGYNFVNNLYLKSKNIENK